MESPLTTIPEGGPVSPFRVRDLHDALPPYTSEIAGADRRKKYEVVAVLNAGEGPDENRLMIFGVEWDDDMGQMRLLVE